MPFPVGLIQVAKQAPQLVPWAWGINSCTSLISAILATVLAIHFGFIWPLLIAALLYISAGMLELRCDG